jgi:hypothetical protein
VGAAVTARALVVSAQPGDASAVTVLADGSSAAGVSLEARGCLGGGLYARLASAAPQYPAFGSGDTPFDAATLDGSGSTNSSLRVVGDNPRAAVLTLESSVPAPEGRVVLDSLGGYGFLRPPSATFWEALPAGGSAAAYPTGAWTARRLSAGHADAATGWTRHGPPGGAGLTFNLSEAPLLASVPVLSSTDSEVYHIPVTLGPHQGVVVAGGVYRVRAWGAASSAGGTQLRLRSLGSIDAALSPPAFVAAPATLATGSSAFAATGGSQTASELADTLLLAAGAVLELQQYFEYGAEGNGGRGVGAPGSEERFACLELVQLSVLG